MTSLYSALVEASARNRVPKITAYNRLDGPGSSLDLREFQESFWRMPTGPAPSDPDAFAEWSRFLPRTVGITISTGCVVEARPHRPGFILIASHDFGYEYEMPTGRVPYAQELWLLKIMDIFGLDGVRFDLFNVRPGIKLSGLGGSAAAATGVALLANALTGAPFNSEQIVALAALIEQDMGVSITGTQEQSNVVFGGVTDYVWFPWGIPGDPSGFGTSMRRTLLTEADYPDLAARLRLYHSGTERSSTDVNAVWRQRLSDSAGYELHLTKLSLAYDFREGLRTHDWLRMGHAIGEYRRVRTTLCNSYMTPRCWDMQAQCERHGAESFPVGAGGGGAVLVFCPQPDRLRQLDQLLGSVFPSIEFSLRPRGHEFQDLPPSDASVE